MSRQGKLYNAPPQLKVLVPTVWLKGHYATFPWRLWRDVHAVGRVAPQDPGVRRQLEVSVGNGEIPASTAALLDASESRETLNDGSAAVSRNLL